MARELGLFEKHGIDVTLQREIGWATVRDKLLYGELDAAAAPAGLVVAASCGLGNLKAECLTGLILNLHGNAITLSQRLWRRGVRDGRTLRTEVLAKRGTLTFAVVHQHSSHNFLLRQWLRAHSINPDKDVRIVVVPPSQGPAYLRVGHLDGYCVGEPWNSLAVMSRTGWIVTTSPELSPQHPEKVLMVRRDFADSHHAEHLALIAALYEACQFCDEPAYREQVAETIARPEYVAAPVQALRPGLSGEIDCGHGRFEERPDFHTFFRDNANEPTSDKARWVVRSLQALGHNVPEGRVADWFRADLFHQATSQLNPTTTR